MSKHRCQTCRVMHSAPKARNALQVITQAIVFGVIEVLAALTLDGWLSIGLWAIAGWNAALLALLVIGLAALATEQEVNR